MAINLRTLDVRHKQYIQGNHTPALMVLGTGSHVGKSILTAALGRILSDEGYRVAPFKAQNMSLNSAATPDGREIGRAQALQAEACRVTPCAEMNPILLKPATDVGCQVVLLGQVWGQTSASDYHLRRVEDLFPVVIESYQKLAAEHDVIVIEGAGSPAEINLMEHDIVNMRMARAAGAACLLVGDIDRGGVFASVLGTLELLYPEDRALVRGYLINKFRGDVELLRPGIDMMYPRLGIPCAGVVPYLRDLGLDEEDGVAADQRRMAAQVWKNIESTNFDSRALRIAVIAFPHLSNFTDFDPLAAEPSVSLAYVERPEELAQADLIILPGSKQTVDDLNWMDRTGFSRTLIELNANGRRIIGICGGFQMLGKEIADPYGTENNGTAAVRPGLALLDVRTIFGKEKTTRQVSGNVLSGGIVASEKSFVGYEIHVGETEYLAGAKPFARICRTGLADAVLDGAISEDGRIFGTYVHGIFDDDNFRHAFTCAIRKSCNLAPTHQFAFVRREREARLDRLAATVRESIDINLLLGWMQS